MILKILLKITFISLLFIEFSCSTNKDPITTNQLIHIDSAVVWINDGIYMKFEGFENEYSLDDTLNFSMKLINQNSPEDLIIFISMWPPLTNYDIYNENNQLVFEYPTIYGALEFRDTLSVGDSLFESLEWNQSSNVSEYEYHEPKVYSGYYMIKGTFRGNNLTAAKHLIKWIKITEAGDPLFPFIYRDWQYKPVDSLVTSLIIRNRTSKNLSYTLNQNNPLNIYYVTNTLTQDTVLSFRINDLPNIQNKIEFSSHSDKLIYNYGISENDSLLIGLWGAYHLIFELNCLERTFIASQIITLYN